MVMNRSTLLASLALVIVAGVAAYVWWPTAKTPISDLQRASQEARQRADKLAVDRASWTAEADTFRQGAQQALRAVKPLPRPPATRGDAEAALRAAGVRTDPTGPSISLDEIPRLVNEVQNGPRYREAMDSFHAEADALRQAQAVATQEIHYLRSALALSDKATATATAELAAAQKKLKLSLIGGGALVLLALLL